MARQRTFPRRTLEQALRVPRALREYNGGNPWPTEQVANALGVGPRSGNFFYISASSRDFGLTEGTRETAQITLTELGRRAVYPQSDQEERAALLQAFLNVEPFRRALQHFGGNNLPERRFLSNTLEQQFGVAPEFHDEFIELFDKNCRFLGIGKEFSPADVTVRIPSGASGTPPEGTVTVATPEAGVDAPVCFVAMPFTEREDEHEPGFFEEVLSQIFTPALTSSGFSVQTARRAGSDLIQSTIVNDLLAADLVLCDLTEHNPNVLFELGMRMREDKPVALVRALGTGPIFDVDTVLRIAEYNPSVWPSTVERDVPRIAEHIRGTWDNREAGATYMRILRREI